MSIKHLFDDLRVVGRKKYVCRNAEEELSFISKQLAIEISCIDDHLNIVICQNSNRTSILECPALSPAQREQVMACLAATTSLEDKSNTICCILLSAFPQMCGAEAPQEVSLQEVSLQEKINQVRKYQKDYLLCSVLFLCLAVLTAVIAVFATEDSEHMWRILVFCVPAVLTISVWFLGMGLRYRPVLAALEQIHTDQVVPHTVDCIKVRNMRYLLRRSLRPYSMSVVKVLWCRENGEIQKYYYVSPCDTPTKRREAPCYTTVNLYQGSCIIHSLNISPNLL